MTLQENKGIPVSLLFAFSAIAATTIANLYYSQPLLNRISRDLNVSEFAANMIPMIAQLGFAIGLMFIVPLGDLYKRRTIIITNFLLLSLALIGFAMAQNIWVIYLLSAITGMCSIMPQLFIPIAAQFSTPERKSQNVGIIVSGILSGILGSRVVSGIIGEYWGWRTMYYVAAVLMFICIFVVMRILPDMPKNYNGTYKGLMLSLYTLIKRNKTLRLVSLRAGLCFSGFFCLWACLAYKMSEAPFYADNDTIGMLGLCGIAGAMSASLVGRYVRKLGVRKFNYIGGIIMISSWCVMYVFQNYYLGIILGIIMIDIGMQCVQISNHTFAFTLAPDAPNRVNTVFMTTFFICGSLGTFLAGVFWQYFRWEGVTFIAILLIILSLSITSFSKTLR